MSRTKYFPNGRQAHKIICQKCGGVRWVRAQNFKQVKYCEKCYYLKRRASNSAFVKQWRQRKKVEKQKIKSKKNYARSI